jgi:acetyl-CoA carboxylase carboxyl transferase subunit beta
VGKNQTKDAVRTGVGKSKGKELVICCMDFAWLNGRRWGEEKKLQEELIMPLKQTSFVMISKSEEPYDGSSLFLDAISKTSVKLAQLADAKLPYISLCTDPTTEELPLLMLGDKHL